MHYDVLSCVPGTSINLNDGFAGGDLIEGNLIFGMVRETNDHGPINTWDRGPYVTLRGATPGVPGTTPAWKIIQNNFLINGGNWPLDHDDGSRYILDRFNVLVYGGTKNYHGYNKRYYGNLMLRPDLGCGNDFCGENDASGVMHPLALNESWTNNTCATAGIPYAGACDSPSKTSSTSMQYAYNHFLTPSGDSDQLQVSCDGVGPPPPPPPVRKCAQNTTKGCVPKWHCSVCKVNANNPTDCMGGCDHGYHFKREYWDCTGECVNTTLPRASPTAPAPTPRMQHSTRGTTAPAPARDHSEGTINFTAWQAMGWDRGSTVAKMPAAAGLIDLARETLARHE